MAGASLSTHVLDTRLGRPASGLAVSLHRLDGGAAAVVAERRTDDDGRIRELGASLAPGTYRLAFEVGAYFAAQGERAFFARVTVDLELGEGHHHVPLLVSPFACVSYRGS